MIISDSVMAHISSQGQFPLSSGYRIKFGRNEFASLLEQSGVKRVYRVSKYLFFSYDGFVMFTEQWEQVLMYAQIIDGIEFSNSSWQRY